MYFGHKHVETRQNCSHEICQNIIDYFFIKILLLEFLTELTENISFTRFEKKRDLFTIIVFVIR